jgi:FkbM family methyltransferase
MLNTAHFLGLCRNSRAVHLSFVDACKWLWSYYRSRLPALKSSAEHSLTLTLHPEGFSSFPVCIRTNGADCGVVNEIFLDNTYPVVKGNIKTILDLGGNIGMTALLYSFRYPNAKICTVEASPENLAILRENLRLNGCSAAIVPAAVAAKDGKISFLLSDDPQQNAALKEGTIPGHSQRVVEVDAVSVPTLMGSMGWNEIDLLKIDIEGGENDVLGGRPEWLRRVNTIVGEGHFGAEYDIDRCRRDLEPMGFSVTEISRNAGSMTFSASRN